MEVRLLVKSTSGQAPRDYVFPIKNRVVLGRSPESPVLLEGAAISREHLALELVGSTVYATDLSNNGTWINGNRLKREERLPLENGDSLEVPDYQISFQIRNPTAARPTAEQQPVPAVDVAIAPGAFPPTTESVRPRGHDAVKPARRFSLLDIWILFLAVLVVALIIYWFFGPLRGG